MKSWIPRLSRAQYGVEGEQQLVQLRGQTEVALGERFDRRKFNDFIVGQGLLPPDLMQRAAETEFVPSASER